MELTQIQCHIGVHVSVSNSSLYVRLLFRLSKLSKGQALNVASALSKALQCLTDNSFRTVREQCLVTEYHLRLAKRSNNFLLDSSDLCIHTEIEKAVCARPHSKAISAWDADMTYYELNDLSTRLAHYLSTLGVGPEVLVSVCFEKSAWVVVAMLGVLKAGGAYTTMDPNHPPARQKVIADETGARILLTSAKYLGDLSHMFANAFVVSRDNVTNLPAYDYSPRSSVNPRNSAYVLFTSGSTGKPKGSITTHLAFSSGATTTGKEFQMDYNTRFFQFASYTFMVCGIEMFMTLMHGGCVCIASDHDRENDLVGCLTRLNITHTIMTPTVLRTLSSEAVKSVKCIVIAAEAVLRNDVLRWVGLTKVVSAYGSTEGMVTIYDNDMGRTRTPNMGYPRGAHIWLVDPNDHNQLVPSGCIGEIAIQGPSLGRGYLDDPVKTKDRFIEQPQWLHDVDPHTKWTRVYKSGDLARYNSDGTLNFIGRKDFQIKVRGQRVDLLDIERLLWINELLVMAAVVRPNKGHFRDRLVALVSLVGFSKPRNYRDGVRPVEMRIRDSTTPLMSRLRDDLAAQLPTYMIPSAWIPLENLPLTMSRKLDRMKVITWLENMDSEMYKSLIPKSAAFENPKTEMEKCIRRVCGHALNRPPSDINMAESFTTLGGDSLSAMQVVTRCRESEKVVLTVQDILQSSSLAVLASKARMDDASSEMAIESSSGLFTFRDSTQSALLDTLATELAELGISDIHEIEDIYPCSPMQNALLLNSANSSGLYETHYIWELSLPSGGAVDIAQLGDAWQAVVARHPAMRTIFLDSTTREGLHNQLVRRSIVAATKSISCDAEDAAEVLKAQPPSTFERAQPPHELTFCKASNGRVWIRLDISHVLTDANSIWLLQDELSSVYLKTHRHDVPAPQLKRFISFLQDRPKEPDISYWKSHLANAETCNFPTWNDGANGEGVWRESVVDLSLPTSIVQSFCMQRGITISSLIQVVWALVLRTYTQQDNVSFGLILSGRDAPVHGIQNAVGIFLNLMVRNLVMGEQTPIDEVLRKGHSDFLAGLDHQYSSLGDVQHELDLSGRQLFNSLLSLQRYPSIGDLRRELVFKDVHLHNPTEVILTSPFYEEARQSMLTMCKV